jgi:hypothetical protein
MDPGYGRGWWDQHAADVYCTLGLAAMAALLLVMLPLRSL